MTPPAARRLPEFRRCRHNALVPTSSRQHEHARRVAPFIWQTMNERGIHCRRVDVDAALQELDAVQLQSVEEAARLLAKGGDSSSAFEVLADFRSISRGELRAALKAEGVVWWADVLLRVCRAGESRASFAASIAVLQQAGAGPKELAGVDVDADADVGAVAELRALCGALAADSPSLPERAQPALESAPQVPNPPGRRPRPPAPAARHQAHQAVVATNSGALVLVLVLASATPGEDPRSTLVVEGAQTGGEGFDWSGKISMQLAVQDLPQVLALFMGWLPGLELARDGRTLVFRRQDDGILCELADGQRIVQVPIAEGDRYALSMLALSALALNEPVLDGAAIMSVVQAQSLTSPPA